MNSIETLYNKYKVRTEIDSLGTVWFSGLGRWTSLYMGDSSAWEEISLLMADAEQHAKEYLKKDDRIIITGQRQVLVLRPDEVRSLLTHDPNLYVKALKRGKSEKRRLANERR